MTREHLLGICYTCQKCLICFTSESCECKKHIKPTRVSKPERGQQIYSHVFTPNNNLHTSNQFLFDANTKFQYNSDFNNTFSFIFCTACNSKFQRLKGNDKTAKQKDRIVKYIGKKKKTTKKLDKSAIKMSNESIDFADGDDNDEVSEFSETEECNIDEIKLHIAIEKKGKKTSTSKTITIKPVGYIKVIEGINSAVQRALKNDNLKPSDYSMSYKAINARGPSSELEDKLDFNEFIEDYKKVIAAGKKMSVIVIIGNDEKSKSKRSKISDESDLSASEVEKISSNSKKKKKSCAIQENDLSKEEKTKAETITALREKYKCNIHQTSCFIQENRHLQLNPARLQLWAREIINNGATYDVPPMFPTFSAALGA